uniref:Uncharacterized protein n=1 Tax=Arundo donax TaxID=35708 RepID=A0A0A8Y8Y2_ARUDO
MNRIKRHSDLASQRKEHATSFDCGQRTSQLLLLSKNIII